MITFGFWCNPPLPLDDICTEFGARNRAGRRHPKGRGETAHVNAVPQKRIILVIF